MEVRTRLRGSFLPPCSMAFISSSRKAAAMSSLVCGDRSACDFAQEMGGAVGGVDLTAHVQRDPFGARGDYADIVLPGRRIRAPAAPTRSTGRRSGAVEIAESALADGAETVRRVGIAGQDDFGFGADGTYARAGVSGGRSRCFPVRRRSGRWAPLRRRRRASRASGPAESHGRRVSGDRDR